MLNPPVPTISPPLQGLAPRPDRIEPVPQRPVAEFVRVNVDPAALWEELLKPGENRSNEVIIRIEDTGDDWFQDRTMGNDLTQFPGHHPATSLQLQEFVYGVESSHLTVAHQAGCGLSSVQHVSLRR